MITAVILLPVVAVLLWLYWYLLPGRRRWRWVDTSLLVVLSILAVGFLRWALTHEFDDPSPLWPELVSAVGAYAIFACGLALGLVLRRRYG